MHTQAPPTCATCGALSTPDRPLALITWDEELTLCPPCYRARILEVDQANAVACALEVIRWHHHSLNGYAIPPWPLCGRRWI